jgi:hypothetical protein
MRLALTRTATRLAGLRIGAFCAPAVAALDFFRFFSVGFLVATIRR